MWARYCSQQPERFVRLWSWPSSCCGQSYYMSEEVDHRPFSVPIPGGSIAKQPLQQKISEIRSSIFFCIYETALSLICPLLTCSRSDLRAASPRSDWKICASVPRTWLSHISRQWLLCCPYTWPSPEGAYTLCQSSAVGPSMCKTEIINLISVFTYTVILRQLKTQIHPSSPSSYSLKSQSEHHPSQRLLSSPTGSTLLPTDLAPTPVKF